MAELRIPLDIPDLEIISQAINSKGEIILSVKSLKTETPCHKCGKPATIRYEHAPEITRLFRVSSATSLGIDFEAL